MAPTRITEEFVHHYRLLRDQSGNSPNGVRRAQDKNPELAQSIEKLNEIWQLVENHRKYGKRRFIPQTHQEFYKALIDFKQRWMSAYWHFQDWGDIRAGRRPTLELLHELFQTGILRPGSLQSSKGT